MKKAFLTLGLALATTCAFAQSNLPNAEDREVGTTTKSGQKILPQAGDIAIGIDATSFLEYAGNSLNGNTDNKAPNFSYENGDGIFGKPAIFVKYFLSDNSALRVKLHLGFNSKTYKNLVRDDEAYANDNTSEAKVEDSYKLSNSGLGLRVGYEMRRGYGRLQGFYGVEAGVGFGSMNTRTYDYGNAMNVSRNGATSTTWYSDGTVDDVAVEGTRDKKIATGSTFTGLVGLFAGVEYFVAPKLSIGGEVGLNLQFASTGKAKTEKEQLNKAGNGFETKTTETAGNSSFDFSTKYSAALTVAFHF